MDVQNTSLEGNQTGTEGTQTGKTFTQEDVNRIVQERLAKEKGKGNDEFEKRTAELDRRERRLNAIEELRKNELPDYLVDALNMGSDEDFQKSMEALKKWKGESTGGSWPAVGTVIGRGNPIGTVGKGSGGDPLRSAFGLE